MSTSEDARRKQKQKNRRDPPDFARSITCPSVNMTNFEEPSPHRVYIMQQKKGGEIRSECTSISDVVYLRCICICSCVCSCICICICMCISVLLWHKPIKPRLIGHVKWRNRARTQVWHFIIISTVCLPGWLLRFILMIDQSVSVSVSASVSVSPCAFSERVSAQRCLDAIDTFVPTGFVLYNCLFWYVDFGR